MSKKKIGTMSKKKMRKRLEEAKKDLQEALDNLGYDHDYLLAEGALLEACRKIKAVCAAATEKGEQGL